MASRREQDAVWQRPVASSATRVRLARCSLDEPLPPWPVAHHTYIYIYICIIYIYIYICIYVYIREI